MTREEFFEWAEMQDPPYEFDGTAPVRMPDGTVGHSQIRGNIMMALHTRLCGTGCYVLMLGAGVATVGNAVRYPDVLVSCTPAKGTDRLVPGVTAVFEVVSLDQPAIDHITKVREYWAVPSIRTYVIVEQQSIGLTVLERRHGDSWSATALIGGDTLRLQGPDLDIPVTDFYVDMDFGSAAS